MPRADISHRRVTVDGLGPDRLDQGDLIDNLGRPGQELADPRSRLAAAGELVLEYVYVNREPAARLLCSSAGRHTRGLAGGMDAREGDHR